MHSFIQLCAAISSIWSETLNEHGENTKRTKEKLGVKKFDHVVLIDTTKQLALTKLK